MSNSQRALVVIIAILGFVPVATGLLAIFGGPSASPGGEQISASLDSEYRFLNGIWVAAGLILWWSLRRPLERALVTRVILVVASVAGLARIIPAIQQGLPHPAFVAAWVLELLILPFIVWWHSRAFPVPKKAAAGTP